MKMITLLSGIVVSVLLTGSSVAMSTGDDVPLTIVVNTAAQDG
jgi:hypothetical protein